MKVQEKYNIISMIGFILILICSIIYLVMNFKALFGGLIYPISEFPSEILNLVNFFILIIFIIAGLGISITVIQFERGFSSIRAGELISLTFSLNIIAIIAIVKIQSVTDYYYTDASTYFLSYLGITIFLNCIAFFGSLMMMIKKGH
ncbi:MAG: hypothetical protein ACFFC9_09245 [Promethearchaeota archaeon]